MNLEAAGAGTMLKGGIRKGKKFGKIDGVGRVRK